MYRRTHSSHKEEKRQQGTASVSGSRKSSFLRRLSAWKPVLPPCLYRKPFLFYFIIAHHFGHFNGFSDFLQFSQICRFVIV